MEKSDLDTRRISVTAAEDGGEGNKGRKTENFDGSGSSDGRGSSSLAYLMEAAWMHAGFLTRN